MQTTTSNDKLKSLFGDLGKPTLRGIRKCPKCGTCNGTRGLKCKNVACDVVFKETSEKKKATVDAVRLTENPANQIYSVRVRDRGPDYRGFVQLSVVQDLDGTDDLVDSPMTTARCFIETCQKTVQDDGDSLGIEPCQHVKAAVNCFATAEQLSLKNSVLNALSIPNDARQAIWMLATETEGPLVQRVSKNVMVVKCKETPKHPLGYVNVSFWEHSRTRDGSEHRFHCSCKLFKNQGGIAKEENTKRCVHFYACVCAFAGDSKLAEEFSSYIELDITPPEQRFVAIFGEGDQQQEVEVLPDGAVLLAAATGTNIIKEYRLIKKRKKSEPPDCFTVQATNTIFFPESDILPSKLKKALLNQSKKAKIATIDETSVSLSFVQWLASVTERINQTMHYQFDGHPETLVFHTTQSFFECLQQRISAGTKKKRLPNSTTGFVRKDAPPVGTFSKYAWHITSIFSVKNIFDTAEMPLEITRGFVKNKDGTYDPYVEQDGDLTETFKKTENTPLIKPMEYKTFLKVGNTTFDQKDPTPFIIEWIPDVLPKSKIGELRIKFEFGHQRNGQLDLRPVQLSPSHIFHLQPFECT